MLYLHQQFLSTFWSIFVRFMHIPCNLADISIKLHDPCGMTPMGREHTDLANDAWRHKYKLTLEDHNTHTTVVNMKIQVISLCYVLFMIFVVMPFKIYF